MMKYFLFLVIGLFSLNITAQNSATSKTVIIKGVSVVDPMAKPTSFEPVLKNLEAPIPGGNSYKAFINKQKIRSEELFGIDAYKNGQTQDIEYGQAEDPTILNEMNMRRYLAPVDQEGIYTGGNPLDNTMAMNENYLLASVNSFLWAYDLKGDSNLFVDEVGSTYVISFAQFGAEYGTDNPFDPKLLYIPKHDKFIFLFLSGREPTDSKIIVGFSSTNDPRDPWNVYEIPGNPRGVDQWSDFPMMGFDDDNMFLSINLLKKGETWQAGFQGSIVWQLPLSDGFLGDSNLTTTLYDDILYNGANIRNLTPVQPGDKFYQESKGMLFLSSRNFDLQNDSLFLIEISSSNELTTWTLPLPKPYGMPPNGIQGNDNPNDPTDGLQTNDARFLGAIKYKNSQGETFIEFVGNTKDFTTSRAGIYHGIMNKTSEADEYTLTANIIGMDSLDFGYPNIAYVNNGQGCYEGSFIAFNHTSATTFAGVSGIRHSNADGYSNIIRLKEGDGMVQISVGTNQRWGDYFGIQSIPNNPSEIWTAGYYGTNNNRTSTWFNKVSVSDSTLLKVDIARDFNPNFVSSVAYSTEVNGGYLPFTYLWTNGSEEPQTIVNLNSGDNYLKVEDSKNCVVTSKTNSEISPINTSALFPNPVTDYFSIIFNVNEDTKGSFGIYDMAGRLITNLGDQPILTGKNIFRFSTRPLLKGQYVLVIKDSDDNNIVQESFVKL